MSSGGGDTNQQQQADSVGSLLAAVANLTADGLRILRFSDKRQWGPDEHEQVRALEELLDEARKDFQELSPLLNGQLNYENDRTREFSCIAVLLLGVHTWPASVSAIELALDIGNRPTLTLSQSSQF